MTILKLDLQAGKWRAVPPSLFEDERLSLDTRGVAGYITTRSETFALSVGGLCALLAIGADKWKRMNYELTQAGYLKRSEGKDERGRFRHELIFSPIPEGGFPQRKPKKRSVLAPISTPKTKAEPSTAKAPMAPPSAAATGSTRELDLPISDNHQKYDGGGALEPTDYQPPQMWIEAANYEICIEEQVRPIRNRAGLLQSILSRYRSNGGPGNAIFVAISSKKAADSAREASDEAAREQARLEREQTHAESLRLSAAKAEATIMTREERRNLFGIVELTVPIKPSNNTRDAFIEYGEILRGPLCRPLVQKLLIQADEA